MPFVTVKAGCFQFALRLAISSGATFKVIDLVATLISILSLSLTKPINPPSKASGVTWPTTNPWVPPLNLPSVINATDFPKPAPIIAKLV